MLFMMIELDSGSTIPLTIKETSIVNAYIELPRHIKVVLVIKETGGLRQVSGLSSEQDSNVSNFLKQRGF
jgi:hypothetical protein